MFIPFRSPNATNHGRLIFRWYGNHQEFLAMGCPIYVTQSGTYEGSTRRIRPSGWSTKVTKVRRSSLLAGYRIYHFGGTEDIQYRAYGYYSFAYQVIIVFYCQFQYIFDNLIRIKSANVFT